MTAGASFLVVSSCALVGVSFAGLAYVLLRAVAAGATAYTGAYSERTARDFEDLFLFIPSRRIAEIGWACAIAVFLVCALLFFDPRRPVATLVGLALGTVGGALALLAPNRLLALLRERRRKRFNIQLVDALAHMSNALKAGFSLNQAFETVVENGQNPIAQEFHVFLQQLRVGMPFNDALRSLEQRVGSEDLTLVVTTIDIARRTGGNLTEVFDRIGLTIRERMRIESRVRTLTAQGRLQGIVVGAMPLFLGIALTVLRPGMMLPFLNSLTGMIAVAAVVVLVTLGALLIRKIIRIDV